MKVLQQHQTTSCGLKGNRSQYDLMNPPPAAHISYDQEMVGQEFGWVKIINSQKRWKKNWKDPMVLTQCKSCEAVQWTNLYNLKSGKSKGCQQCSQPRRIPKWLDRRFTAAKQRCTNPQDAGYPNYGGRGIRFCFDSVLEAGLWMLTNCGLPGREMEIDRIEVNGNYEPGNLRWVTHQVNCANQRRYMTSSIVAQETVSPSQTV